jgi:hypothetical protein
MTTDTSASVHTLAPSNLFHHTAQRSDRPDQLRRSSSLCRCPARGKRWLFIGVSVDMCAMEAPTSPVLNDQLDPSSLPFHRREHRATLVAERRACVQLGLALATHAARCDERRGDDYRPGDERNAGSGGDRVRIRHGRQLRCGRRGDGQGGLCVYGRLHRAPSRKPQAGGSLRCERLCIVAALPKDYTLIAPLFLRHRCGVITPNQRSRSPGPPLLHRT